ncbi:MAG: methyltransferase domain-containing protein [Candidatus Woesearchaeota archaeon]
MQVHDWDEIAKDYFHGVVSPFANKVENPLYADLKQIQHPEKLHVIDLGCGIGNLVPHVQNFARVACVDFSPGMLAEARNKYGHLEHVTFHEKDITELHEFHSKFDVAVAVNSFVMPDMRMIQKAFDEAFAVLKTGGNFFGIFPAMENVAYMFLLAYERHYENLKSPKKAYERASSDVQADSYDFKTGHVEEEGFQKHYYLHGILHRLKKAGFSSIEFSKVKYPWKMAPVLNNTEYAKEEHWWDWYVRAKK